MTRRSHRKDWRCQECGRRMTLRQAERAVTGIIGCRGCGGTDIDLVQPDEGAAVVEGADR